MGAANTSHFLQPCDQNVNWRFKSSIRHFRDELCKASLIDTRQVAVHLACGVHRFESITLKDARLSFKNTRIYPFDPAFPLRFAKTDFVAGREVEKEKARLENAGVASRLPAVRQRQSDTATISQVMSILESTEGPSQTLQKPTLLLRDANTVNKILVRSAVPRSGSAVIKPVNLGRSRVSLDCGAPAECVIMAESIEKRRQKDASQLRSKLEKEQ